MENNETKIEQFGTRLTLELTGKAISFNGFMPVLLRDNWYTFKNQGTDYYVEFGENYKLQFYICFLIDAEKQELNLRSLKQAAAMINSVAQISKITFDQEGNNCLVQFRVFGIEKTYEHLCMSFMDYINELHKMIDAHMYEYRKLENDSQQNEISIPTTPDEVSSKSKTLS